MNLTAGQKLFAELAIDMNCASLSEFNAYIAIEHFLTNSEEPLESDKNLKQIDHYLHAFYHLCDISKWKQASQVLSFCPISKELHEQLRIWGYYREQIELYQNLLEKVSPEQDLVYLNGLGRACYNLSDFDRAWDYHSRQLQLARQVKNRHAEALAIAGLGSVQFSRLNYIEAIALFQQQLDIAREIGDQQQEGYALNSLGYALYVFGVTRNKQKHYQNGLIHLHESLEIARKCGDSEMEIFCLRNVTRSYFNLGQYDRVLILIQRQLDICDKNNDKRGKYFVLEDLGQCHTMLKQYDQAIQYAKEALSIVRELGDKCYESATLNTLGVIYGYKLQRYQEALPYFEKSLEILQKINLKKRIAIVAASMFNCHCFLKHRERADFYLNMAKSFAVQSDSLEEKGLVMMAIANAYWGSDKICYKAWGIVLVIKSLIMIPPWHNINGRIAMQVAIREVLGIKT